MSIEPTTVENPFAGMTLAQVNDLCDAAEGQLKDAAIELAVYAVHHGGFIMPDDRSEVLRAAFENARRNYHACCAAASRRSTRPAE